MGKATRGFGTGSSSSSRSSGYESYTDSVRRAPGGWSLIHQHDVDDALLLGRGRRETVSKTRRAARCRPSRSLGFDGDREVRRGRPRHPARYDRGGHGAVAAGLRARLLGRHRRATIRIDAGPGVLIEAVWVVRRSAGGEPRMGRTVASESAGDDGFELLAAEHSRASRQGERRHPDSDPYARGNQILAALRRVRRCEREEVAEDGRQASHSMDKANRAWPPEFAPPRLGGFDRGLQHRAEHGDPRPIRLYRGRGRVVEEPDAAKPGEDTLRRHPGVPGLGADRQRLHSAEHVLRVGEHLQHPGFPRRGPRPAPSG